MLIKDKAGKKTPVALLCTNEALGMDDILAYFIRRWATEVTFEESRAHLGVKHNGNGRMRLLHVAPHRCLAYSASWPCWADKLQQQQKLPAAQAA